MDIDHEEFNNNTTPHDMFQQSYSTDHSAGTLLFSSNYPGAATAPRDGYAPGPYSSSTWVGNDTNVSGTFDAAPTHHNTPASGLHTLDGHSDSDPGSGEHEDNEPFGGGHGTMHEAIKAELSEEPEQETPARPTRKGRPRKTSPGKGDRVRLSVGLPSAVRHMHCDAAANSSVHVQKSRRRHHDTRRTLSPHNAGVRGDRKKRSKLPPELRGETARARQLHCCLRCRNQRIRCKEDPQNPSGPCLTCKSISRPTLSQLPCIRAIVTQGVLYREQHCPNPLHTRRWKEFPPPGKLPEDIPEHDFVPGAPVRWVQISHVVLPGCAYTIGVRAYYPRELIDRTWECWEQQDPVTGKGSVVYHECPVFAIANVAETAAMIRKFLEDNIETYVNGFIGKLGELHIRTYDEAMRHARESEVRDICSVSRASSMVPDSLGSATQEAEERELLRNVLLLWTACRKVSNIEYLCGDDRLDGVPVSDPSSPWEGMVPMPPIMIGQFEAIIYSTILRPLNKTVLDQLQAFFLAPKRKHWYTVYLALFVLLHSCSMLTRRNSEFAAKIDWPLPYMNPFSIKKLHFSAVILIAHFHYISRGERPFDNAMEFTSTSLKENEGFTQQQLEFIKLTADLVRQRGMYAQRERVPALIINYWIRQTCIKDGSRRDPQLVLITSRAPYRERDEESSPR